MAEAVKVSREGSVSVVRLQEATMGPVFFDELGEAFRALSLDDEVRAVVIASEAKAFSYGLDLPKVMQSHGQMFAGGGLASQRSQLRALILRWQACFTAVARCPVPVIAAIHGWCIGGGLDLATACDLRLCTEDAKISLRETRIAIVADLGSLQRLPTIVGAGHAREMAFVGGDLDAQRALRIGLVNETFSNREALLNGALALANRIAANPPLTVRGVKEVMTYGERQKVDAGLDYVAAWNSAFLASEDLSEAMAAFMTKREPQFKGR